MIELRFHGRGGQGTVVASRILAEAMFMEGKYVQSFPAFGVERRGAPVAAFLRADSTPIRLRCQVYKPEHLIVLDQALLFSREMILAGLEKHGAIVANYQGSLQKAFSIVNHKIAVVDASGIAYSHGLGTRANPIVNTAILGAFIKITNLAKPESLEAAIKNLVPVKASENIKAAFEAYEKVVLYES